MPWTKLETIMHKKQEFLFEVVNNKSSITELCKRFGISRKTGYKWIKRYKENGIQGLQERSRRPLVSPNRIKDEAMGHILTARDEYKAWGGRKLKQYLINQGVTNLPCEKTFNRTLKRFDKIDPKESEKRTPFIRFERETPNDLWQMDFKGHFQIEEGRCHPLTILDDYSRFSICIKACIAENEISVKSALEEAFRVYGLPNGMTMDNGSPWKGSFPFKLSKLTVWLMRLGIRVSHSTPYHPQTQGKLERFHRSLKEEVLKFYQPKDLEDSQMRFDEWREIYNNRRPHEGIDLKCPVSRYKPSIRKFPEILPMIDYLEGDIVRKVGINGLANFNGKAYYMGEYLSGEYVAGKEVGDGILDVYFSKTKIQRIQLSR